MLLLLLEFKHLVCVLTLLFVEPRVTSEVIPIGALVKYTESLARVDVEINEFVSMGQCLLIVVDHVVFHVLVLLAVNPSSTKEAGTFALLLAYNFSTAEAIVHEAVKRGLAVADLAPRNQELRNVTTNLLSAFRSASHFLVLLVSLSLHFFYLLLVLTSGPDSLEEFLYKFLCFLEARVKETA